MVGFLFNAIERLPNEQRPKRNLLLKWYAFVGPAMFVLQEVFGLKDEYLLCESSKKSGSFILNEILLAGNFGQYDIRTKKNNKEKRIERGLEQLARNLRFVRYYPHEVLLSPIWKCWHYGWERNMGIYSE